MLLLAGAVVLFSVPLGAAAAALPAQAAPFVVKAPPALEPVAQRIRALTPYFLEPAVDLTGATGSQEPIRVVLMEESSPMAKQVPPWYSAFADEATGTIVLFPARAPSYPDDGLLPLLRHEATHVLVGRVARHRPVPRWFDEGLAMTAGREWGFEDRTRFAMAVLAARGTKGSDLDRLFDGGPADVSRAYALAGGMVRDFIDRFGPAFPRRTLAAVGEGYEFSEAFHRATGGYLNDEVWRFFRRQRSLEAWIPALTSTAAVWALMTLLAIWAIRVARRRERLKRERLAALEAARAEAEARAREEAEAAAEAARKVEKLFPPDDELPVN